MMMLGIGSTLVAIVCAAGLFIGCGDLLYHGGHHLVRNQEYQEIHQGCDRTPHHGQTAASCPVDLPKDEETKDSDLK